MFFVDILVNGKKKRGGKNDYAVVAGVWGGRLRRIDRTGRKFRREIAEARGVWSRQAT